jgi:hypothetical protein
MFQIAELQFAPQTLATTFVFVPIEKHIDLFYTGLAIVFVCFISYMFFSKKRQ